MRDMFQLAREHADKGDAALKGEVIGRINQVERTITTLTEQLAGLRAVLGGEPIARPPRIPAFVRDWRFWAAIMLAIAAARSPELVPHLIGFLG